MKSVSYTNKGSIKFKNYKSSIFILSFIMNPMEDGKIPINVSYLKPKVYVTHCLVPRILLPRQINLDIVIKEDVVPLWLLTQQFQTNCVEGVLFRMDHFQQTRTTWLPYRALITKVLVSFGIRTMREIMDSTNNKIYYSLLRRIKICIDHGELRNNII